MISLLARRPLLVHCVAGAAMSMAIGRPLLNGEEDRGAEDPGDVAMNGIHGALRGALMRYWYPTLEGFVMRRFPRMPAGQQTFVKAMVDTLPAQLSTYLPFLYAERLYEQNYGLKPSQSSSDDLLANLLEGSSSSTKAGNAHKKKVEWVMEPAVDSEQLEILEAIANFAPSPANSLSALLSALNFFLVPRQYRGLMGTLQFNLWDVSTEYFAAVRMQPILEAVDSALEQEQEEAWGEGEEEDEDGERQASLASDKNKKKKDRFLEPPIPPASSRSGSSSSSSKRGVAVSKTEEESGEGSHDTEEGSSSGSDRSKGTGRLK